jgi:hypothetical protein
MVQLHQNCLQSKGVESFLQTEFHAGSTNFPVRFYWIVCAPEMHSTTEIRNDVSEQVCVKLWFIKFVCVWSCGHKDAGKKVHQHASERQQRIPTWGAAWHGMTELCTTETCEFAAGAETSCNQDLQRNKRSFHYCCSIKANVTGSCVGLPCSAERHDALRNKLGHLRTDSQLLPKMSFNGFSGDREGRKDKGDGERSRR